MFKQLVVIFALGIVTFVNVAAGDETKHATAQEVISKVNEAVQLIQEQGQGALGKIADPSMGFVWKDTYIFIVNCERDMVVVNPAFPERVGGDIKKHADYAGEPYGKRLCEIAEHPHGGWIEYVWVIPGEDTPRRKVSYVRSVPGTPYQLGAGIYDESSKLSDLAVLIQTNI